ncbi:MAG: 4Fe-4S binding protein [Desulfobacterales bacterium]
MRLLPSTVSFLQALRRRHGWNLGEWLHAWLYARYPYTYIAVATGEHPLCRLWRRRAEPVDSGRAGAFGRAFADGYHGKVILPSAASRLVTLEKPLRAPRLETVLPYPRARDLILEHPDHLVLLDCPCRSARANPCLPLDVCLIVGEPFASFLREHHPRRSRRVSPEEALGVLAACRRRGNVHHAFFKEALLGRFYAICNCCPCCCGAIQAWRNGVPMLAPSGYRPRIVTAACRGCGTCRARCPFGAIALTEGLARVNPRRCLGCGLCAEACPAGAVHLERAPETAAPLDDALPDGGFAMPSGSRPGPAAVFPPTEAKRR